MVLSVQDKNLLDAAKRGAVDEVRKCLSEGADLNAKDDSGSTPLHIAAKANNADVVKLLLNRGADSTARDDFGSTPLHAAAQDGHDEIIQLLLGNYDVLQTQKEADTKQKVLMPIFPITINGNLLDQSTKSVADASKTNYILIQSRARLSPSQRQELAAAGLVLHDYVSKNTYLYGYQGSDLDKIRQLVPVVYIDVYRLEFKIPPSLKEALADSPYTVDVAFHEDVDSDSKVLRDLIAEKSRSSAKNIGFFRQKSRLTVQGRYLNDLASIDEVRRIEEVGKTELRNDQARLILEANVQRGLGAAQQHPNMGEGQVIAVADTGLDPDHPAFQQRVLALYPMNSAPANDYDGHGTHVCGSAAGASLKDDNANVMGIAPRARLVVQCLGNFDNTLPGDFEQLFWPPYNEHGARVHSNSWGRTNSGTQHDYDLRAREIDRFVWKHPAMVICFAAGNDAADVEGTGAISQGQIGAEAAAKNCITVGASETSRPDIPDTYGNIWGPQFPQPPISLRREAADPTLVAAFSSRGPTKEGRFKPDVVAPGTCILSARASQAPNPARPGPGPNQRWCYMSGTSMATPLVAGCAAVLRETLIHNGTSDPSAALIKALLINGAEILSQHTPNNESGFGRINLANSLAVARGEKETAFHERRFGQSSDGAVSLPVAAEPKRTLKATLVWSDPPSESIRNCLLLEVRHADGEERRGYDPDDYENLNNVQQILWQNVPHGNIDVIVKPYDIQILPQSFAVVWQLY